MEQDESRDALAQILLHAYSGELAAACAYRGHALSVRSVAERDRILQIEREELDHRALVGNMLEELGVAADPRRERWMRRVGTTIGWLCRIGAWLLPFGRVGWYIANHGAGRLESQNIVEYEDAARLARQAGLDHLVGDLLTLAEVEWDHERYFREAISGHWLHRWSPRWMTPPPRERIRASMQLDVPEPGLR